MKNRLSADMDYNLWVLLHQASHVIFKSREKELSQYGISNMQAADVGFFGKIDSFVVVDGVEGKKYDDIKQLPGIARVIFDSPNSLHYLAIKDDSVYLVEERIE